MEQLALPGIGENKPLTGGGRSELPSKVLSKLQFEFSPAGSTKPEGPGEATLTEHEISAVHRPTNREVGYLGWHPQPLQGQPGGEISMVQVSPEFRRQGIASRMYEFAHGISERMQRPPQIPGQKTLFTGPAERIVPPVHSPLRSDSGEAWSAAVGGFRPPRSSWRPDYEY